MDSGLGVNFEHQLLAYSKFFEPAHTCNNASPNSIPQEDEIQIPRRSASRTSGIRTVANEATNADIRRSFQAKRAMKQRRAVQACVSCRARKVRCDVTTRSPCNNCVWDNVDCIVQENRRTMKASERAALRSPKSDLDVETRRPPQDLAGAGGPGNPIPTRNHASPTPAVLRRRPLGAPRPSPEQPTSINVCEHASRMVSSLNSTILEGFLPTTGVTIILPAIIIQLLNMRSADPEARKSAVQGFRICLDVVGKLRDLYATGDYATGFLDAALRLAADALKGKGLDTPIANEPEAPRPQQRKGSSTRRKNNSNVDAKTNGTTPSLLANKSESRISQFAQAVNSMDLTLSLTKDLTKVSNDIETTLIQNMPTPASSNDSELNGWENWGIPDPEIEKLLWGNLGGGTFVEDVSGKILENCLETLDTH